MTGALWLARLFVIRSTSGFTLTAGVLAFVAALFVGISANTTSFLPGLADPLNFTLTACLYLAPIGAGAAAAQMAGFHRLGLAELASSTPRGLPAAKWLEIGPVVAWQLVAYSALAVIVLSRSDLSGAASAAMLLLPLQAIVLLVATALVGAAVADAYRPRLVAPVVAGSIFVLLYAVALQTGSVGRFSPTYTDIFYRIPLQPDRRLLLAMTSLLAAVGVVAAARTFDRRVRRGIVTALAGVGVMTAAGVLVTTGSERTEVRPQPDEPLCRSRDGVRLCVWPESAGSVDAGLDALVRVSAIARPYLDTPDVFYESGLRRGTAGDAEYAVPLPREGREMIFAVLAILPIPCDTEDSRRAEGDLISWLLAQVTNQDGGRASPETAAVLALPEPEKRAWVQERVDRLRPVCGA